jgi:hypothetical protein
MAELKPDPIFQVASGFLAAKHLFVAVEIGLFEKLAQGPATLEELGQRTGIPLRTLRITADAMVALRFIERQGERYRNGPLGASFLAGTGHPHRRQFLHLAAGAAALPALSCVAWAGSERIKNILTIPGPR